MTDAANTDGLIAEQLGSDPLVLIASSGHVLAARDAIRFEEALSYDWVGWGETSALHTHLAMRAYQAGVALKVRASVPSAEGVLELVARGLGIGVLPRALLQRLKPGQEIVIVEVTEPWARRHLLVCRRQEPRTAIAAALFSGFKAKWDALEASFSC